MFVYVYLQVQLGLSNFVMFAIAPELVLHARVFLRRMLPADTFIGTFIRVIFNWY
jgi:hypothetical protein